MNIKITVLLIISLLLLNNNIFSEKLCRYSIEAQRTSMSWTAYKTTEKIAVNGSFKNIKVKAPRKKKTIEEIVQKLYFSIDPNGVTIENKEEQETEKSKKERDKINKNIVKFFFKKLRPELKIKGRVKGMSSSQIYIDLKFNEIKKRVTLDYKYLDPQIIDTKNSMIPIKVEGSINLDDWKAQKPLHRLSVAGYDDVKGKDNIPIIWPTIDLKINAKFKKTCH